MNIRRIPPGWQLSTRGESLAVYFYRYPFRGWNGRRIVLRYRGRIR